ncbi:MAG: ferredoxin [Planctomycetaceae bacterium]|nr:ferredoxin [Planctomycetaceae bacterium]
MSEDTIAENGVESRRQFIADGFRFSAVLAGGGMGGFLAGRRSHAAGTRWQIDPDKCVACGNCATYCVLDQSAVKAVQCFDLCGYCDKCTGYFDDQLVFQRADPEATGGERHLCPTDALIRDFIDVGGGNSYYEYIIDTDVCIGCAKCVKGCALMNGSLYLQVMHDVCVDCNECAIAVACPTEAFVNVPEETPYKMKEQAVALMNAKANNTTKTRPGDLVEKRKAQELIERTHVDD